MMQELAIGGSVAKIRIEPYDGNIPAWPVVSQGYDVWELFMVTRISDVQFRADTRRSLDENGRTAFIKPLTDLFSRAKVSWERDTTLRGFVVQVRIWPWPWEDSARAGVGPVIIETMGDEGTQRLPRSGADV